MEKRRLFMTPSELVTELEDLISVESVALQSCKRGSETWCKRQGKLNGYREALALARQVIDWHGKVIEEIIDAIPVDASNWVKVTDVLDILSSQAKGVRSGEDGNPCEPVPLQLSAQSGSPSTRQSSKGKRA